MSHFTVLVIGENPEEQLAPFQENNMTDCPEEYLEFHDEEDECRQNYEKKTTERVVLPNGELINTWDDIAKNNPNYERKQIPFVEIYSTFEEYMKEYCGYNERDKKIGKYGYWENPNAKWDWYNLGGRWTGYFKLKSNRQGTVGSPGLMTPNATDGFVDQAYKKDIDFDYMINDAGKKAQKEYEKLEKLCGGSIPKLDYMWEDILNSDNGLSIDEKRKKYWEQPAYKKMKEIQDSLTNKEDVVSVCWLRLEDYQISKEEYIQNEKNNSLVTFAVLKDGKWYERGKMGWWAVVSNEKDKNEWCNQFTHLITNLSDDTLLSVYDCHI